MRPSHRRAPKSHMPDMANRVHNAMTCECGHDYIGCKVLLEMIRDIQSILIKRGEISDKVRSLGKQIAEDIKPIKTFTQFSGEMYGIR